MEQANEEAGWRYEIKAAESVQITRYKKGGFFNFHTDGRGDHLSAYKSPNNGFLHGNVRKLSMSVMLNDNFDGGSFEFASYSKGNCEITPVEATVGSVIVFPSSVEHRVAPVTKGIRYSLVAWFLGPPFK
jgi:PKHD-type hydroxylase